MSFLNAKTRSGEGDIPLLRYFAASCLTLQHLSLPLSPDARLRKV